MRCDHHLGTSLKMRRGGAAAKMNGNRAISLHRPGVVGTAYTTVSVVN